MNNLKNKVAVITGGDSGIGYVSGVVADQSNFSDIEMLVSEVKAQLSEVDILLINAGITTLATIDPYK